MNINICERLYIQSKHFQYIYGRHYVYTVFQEIIQNIILLYTASYYYSLWLPKVRYRDNEYFLLITLKILPLSNHSICQLLGDYGQFSCIDRNKYFISKFSCYIVCCWLLVGCCHTFSKLVNFECVGMLECWCVGVLQCWNVLVCWSVGAFGALDALEIGRV